MATRTQSSVPTSSAAAEQSSASDIWKSLTQKTKTGELKVTSSQDSTIIFVGGRQSGKTTLINKYISPDKDDTPKPTQGVDYVFSRRPGKDGTAKEVSHIWEIGGGNGLAELLDVCLTMNNIANATLVITLDLSKACDVLNDVLFWLEAIKSRVKKIDAEARAQRKILLERLKERAAKRFGEKHPDKCVRTNLCVQQQDMMRINFIAYHQRELKKIMFRTLRFFCHLHGASLLVTSSQNKQLILNFRNLLGSVSSRSGGVRSGETDHLKPIFVCAGADSIEKIGIPPKVDPSQLSKLKPTELWKSTFDTYFAASGSVGAEGNAASSSTFTSSLDPSGQFAQPDVDIAKAAKEEELARYREEQQSQQIPAQAPPLSSNSNSIARTQTTAAAIK